MKFLLRLKPGSELVFPFLLQGDFCPTCQNAVLVPEFWPLRLVI